MALFDRMKAQAAQVAQKAQEAGRAGQAKLDGRAGSSPPRRDVPVSRRGDLCPARRAR